MTISRLSGGWDTSLSFEQITDIFTLLMNLIGLMMCLFLYFEHTRRSITFAVVFFLTNLLSEYYWVIYTLVMDDSPQVSSFFAYFGWNLAFVAPVFIQLSLRKERGRRGISPVAFLPVMATIPQFLLYLQFGGIFNNIWQCFWTTVIACLAVDAIVAYFRCKDYDKVFPYLNVVLLLFVIFEYTEWTASCYAWPSDALNPYYYFSILVSLCYVLIPGALSREYGMADEGNARSDFSNGRLMRLFKPIYIIFVTVFCVGGYFLTRWIRRTLVSGTLGEAGSDAYLIIDVLLFVVSFVIVTFTVMIILIVNSEKKTFERREIEAAKYLAERSNEAKSDFLANMSHEIRTPINAVLGLNEMILRESLKGRDDLPDEREDIKSIFSEICNYSGNIDSAGKNLLSIINDILDFSKIEAGKLEIVDNDYQLSSVLNDVSNMIMFKAKSKGLEYDVEVDESIPDILHGDEVRVRQIVTNLLNNAVKYTDNGSVTLSVSEKKIPGAAEDDCTSLVFSVKDTGIGIRDEDRSRLFGKFERMDIKKNSTIEGTGLGLAITGNLVEMMGGTIDVESHYGLGSTFTAAIPQKVVSDEAIGDFREKFKASIDNLHARQEPFHAKDSVILVVDDTPMNLMVVKGLLKNTQISIDTAGGGAQSVEMCRQKKYDVILMDQRMPEMDGTTAMRHIREDDAGMNKDTPFVCLTADAVSGAKDKYISEGFDDYLTKPIEIDKLEEVLMEYIDKEKINKVMGGK